MEQGSGVEPSNIQSVEIEQQLPSKAGEKSAHGQEDDYDTSHCLYERKRYYCCLGWQKPFYHNGWKTVDDGKKAKQHPSTSLYRKAMAGDPAASKDWDWFVLINERTDPEGWEYASCCWLRLGKLRLGGRSQERRLDCVKRRQWVHTAHAQQVLSTSKKGAVELLNPVQLAEQQRQAKAKYEEGVAQIWELLAQLDDTTNIKAMASALLDPVAMRAVANLHTKAMKTLHAKALDELHITHIAEHEKWGALAEDHNHHLEQLVQHGKRVTDMIRAGINDLVDKVKGIGRQHSNPPSGPSSPVGRTAVKTPTTPSAAEIHAEGAANHGDTKVASLGHLETRSFPGVITLRAFSLPDSRRTWAATSPGHTITPNNLQRTLSTLSEEAGSIKEPRLPRSLSPRAALERLVRRRFGFMQRNTAGLLSLPASRMALSLPELECAAGHALSIYGDLEHYVGNMPLQSFYTAIEKYTGVPEKDVLMAVWRSYAFKPAHYVAVDHKRQKIVICVRGTMETVDTITDLVSKPQVYDFGPGMLGVCHTGIMQAAQATITSVMDTVLQAVADHPKYDLFATGHSLGGGTAALIALLLRNDTRLPAYQRQRLRAVCLAPAAVVSKNLAWACSHFICSIVYRYDMVPRTDIGSVSRFVTQVAQASPLKRALLSLYQALWYSDKRSKTKLKATHTLAADSKAAGGQEEESIYNANVQALASETISASDEALGVDNKTGVGMGGEVTTTSNDDLLEQQACVLKEAVQDLQFALRVDSPHQPCQDTLFELQQHAESHGFHKKKAKEKGQHDNDASNSPVAGILSLAVPSMAEEMMQNSPLEKTAIEEALGHLSVAMEHVRLSKHNERLQHSKNTADKPPQASAADSSEKDRDMVQHDVKAALAKLQYAMASTHRNSTAASTASTPSKLPDSSTADIYMLTTVLVGNDPTATVPRAPADKTISTVQSADRDPERKIGNGICDQPLTSDSCPIPDEVVHADIETDGESATSLTFNMQLPELHQDISSAVSVNEPADQQHDNEAIHSMQAEVAETKQGSLVQGPCEAAVTADGSETGSSHITQTQQPHYPAMDNANKREGSVYADICFKEVSDAAIAGNTNHSNNAIAKSDDNANFCKSSSGSSNDNRDVTMANNSQEKKDCATVNGRPGQRRLRSSMTDISAAARAKDWKTVYSQEAHKDAPSQSAATSEGRDSPDKQSAGSKNNADNATADSHLQAKVLLQPLLPPGAVYWLLPDTRSHNIVKSAVNHVRHIVDRVGSKETGQQPPQKPSDADMTNLGGSDMQPDMGDLFEGFSDQLDNAEDIADDVAAGKHSKKGGQKPAEQLVLLDADPSWFSDLFFFKKAMLDHFPLAYHQALKSFIAATKKAHNRPWKKI